MLKSQLVAAIRILDSSKSWLGFQEARP